MFRDLLEDLDMFGETEQKMACILALEECTSVIERLSVKIDEERCIFTAAITNDSSSRGVIQVLGIKSTKRLLEEFEVTENADALAASLLKNKITSKYGITESRIKQLCHEYKTKITPFLHRRREILELTNELTFRLYGIDTAESFEIRNDIKDWNL